MRWPRLLCILWLGSAIALADTKYEVVVVANTDLAPLSLSRQEVRSLFMGAALTYDLTPINLPPKNHTRIMFNTKVIGLTESRIQSYWAQMRFTGRKTAPKELADEPEVIEYLLTNPGGISYLSAHTGIPQGLTVLYRSN
jgi:hypothetical protein